MISKQNYSAVTVKKVESGVFALLVTGDWQM